MTSLAPRPGRTRLQAAPVAETLEPVVRRFFGGQLPVGLQGWDGSRAGPPDADVTIVVHRPRALRHLLWAPGELGLARAHVAGDLDLVGDVFALLDLRDHLGAADDHVSVGLDRQGWWDLIRAARRLGVIGPRPPRPAEEARLGGRTHRVRRDAAAISHHYDVGNDFYALLLGPSMTYSCAYWTGPGAEAADAGLTAAQAAKHELVCRKLGLVGGMRLLDVGCGWGSMAIHAASHHGVEVVGITISEEQRRTATERVEAAGLADRVEIRNQDYRQVPDGPFDAISSIGMFEHVGLERTAQYLSVLRELLVPGGRLLNHAISRPDPDDTAGISPHSFVGRYVFPDGALLEVGTVVSAMHRTGLEVRDVQSLREHYARTLRAWVANLEGRWDEAQRIVGPGRARVWRLYLAGSAIGFEANRTSIHQVLAVRPHSEGVSAMPATRAGIDVGEEVGQRSRA